MVLAPVPGKCEQLLQLHSICTSLIEAVEYFEKQRQTDPRAELSSAGQAVFPAKPGSLFLENLLLVTPKRCQTTEG